MDDDDDDGTDDDDDDADSVVGDDVDDCSCNVDVAVAGDGSSDNHVLNQVELHVQIVAGITGA